jgi:hypothetical protein
MPQFTTEDLIQYMYEEMTEEKSEAFEKALEGDWRLKENLDVLEECTLQLDSIITSPRDQTVLAILNYAKRTAVV